MSATSAITHPSQAGTRQLLPVLAGNGVTAFAALVLDWGVMPLFLVLGLQSVFTALAWTWLIAVHARLTMSPEHHVRHRTSIRHGIRFIEVDTSYAYVHFLNTLRFAALLAILSIALLWLPGNVLAPRILTPLDIVLIATIALSNATYDATVTRRQIQLFSFRRLQMQARLPRVQLLTLCASAFPAIPVLMMPASSDQLISEATAIYIACALLLVTRLAADLWSVLACSEISHKDAREANAMAAVNPPSGVGNRTSTR